MKVVIYVKGWEGRVLKSAGLILQERATKMGFPPDKSTLSKEWLSLSLQALTLGRFFDQPEFEALRGES